LFHVPSDPGETKDVSEHYPVETGAMAEELTRRSPRFQTTWQRLPSPEELLTPKEGNKLNEALRALGYAE
jgi:hypothetical protein